MSLCCSTVTLIDIQSIFVTVTTIFSASASPGKVAKTEFYKSTSLNPS